MVMITRLAFARATLVGTAISKRNLGIAGLLR